MFTKLFNRNYDPYQIKGPWRRLYIDFADNRAYGDLRLSNVSITSTSFLFNLPAGQTPLKAIVTDMEFKEGASASAQLNRVPSVYIRPNGQFAISVTSMAANVNLATYLIFIMQES